MRLHVFMLVSAAALLLPVLAQSDDQQKLQNSLKTWKQLRDKHNGDYAYRVRWSSFTGFGHETEIVVRDNKVVRRRFQAFSGRPVPLRPGQPAPKPPTTWVEEGDEIGQHKQGAAARTLDQLYAEAAKVVERDLPDHERRYLRFDKQGLLLSCFTVDTRIADDAPTKGVRISSISLGADSGAESSEKVSGKVYKAPNGKPFPRHWGEPPRIQTRDLRPLPGGYGRGSSTLAGWIQKNLDRDAAKKKREP